jgi:adenylate cyclase
LGVLVALAGIAFALTPFALAWEEETGLAWLFRLRGPRPAPANVVVVAMDGASAQALGQPLQPAQWSRALHARLIDTLQQAGARVIAFDVAFVSASKTPGDDEMLANALSRARQVVLLDLVRLQDTGLDEARVEQRLPPTDALAEVAAAHGPFVLPKPGGSVHAYWLRKPGVGGAETLPLLALRIFEDQAARRALARDGADSDDAVRYLDFYGPPRSVRTVAFRDVIEASSADLVRAGPGPR